MKVLVVYDTKYGNSERIARAIGEAITGDVRVLRVGEVSSSELGTFDLLIVGSPTHGGRSTQAIQDLIKNAPATVFEDTNVASFDTRLTSRWVGIFGYAAGRIAGSLKRKGGRLVVPPEGFFVEGTEGPLKDDEVERAAGWARDIVKSLK